MPLNNLIEEYIILSEDESINEFIEKNEHLNIAQLALDLSNRKNTEKTYILNQVNGLQKSRIKFPALLNTKGLIYPEDISIQQASSEHTAKFKFSTFHGNLAVDLTGGFGIDSIYLSHRFKEIYSIEPSEKLHKIQLHNLKRLNLTNITCIHQRAEEYLQTFEERADLIYVDPSRRSDAGRLLQPSDFSPNPIALLEELKIKTKRLFIKFSPSSDITSLMRLFPDCNEIKVISVKNECKEVLILYDDSSTVSLKLSCTEITSSGNKHFDFDFNEELNANSTFSNALTYVYLPMTSITKAGAFKCVGERFGLGKISANTHVYTSDQLIGDFPGRTFKVFKEIPFNGKSLKREYQDKGFNIITRNFPYQPQQVAKKLGIDEYGVNHLIAFRNNSEKTTMLVCSLLNSPIKNEFST